MCEPWWGLYLARGVHGAAAAVEPRGQTLDEDSPALTKDSFDEVFNSSKAPVAYDARRVERRPLTPDGFKELICCSQLDIEKRIRLMKERESPCSVIKKSIE